MKVHFECVQIQNYAHNLVTFQMFDEATRPVDLDGLSHMRVTFVSLIA